MSMTIQLCQYSSVQRRLLPALLVCMVGCLLTPATVSAQKVLARKAAADTVLECVFEKHRMFINRAESESIETDTRLVVTIERGAGTVVRIDGMAMSEVVVAADGNTITFRKDADFLHDAEGWGKPRIPGMSYTLGFSDATRSSAIMTGVNGAFATVSVAGCSAR